MHAIIAFAVVLIILLGFGIWYQFLSNNSREKSETVPIEDISFNASRLTEGGNIDDAFEYYDRQISLRSDPEEKKTLLIKKSRFAMGNGDVDIALDAAKKANESDSDTRTIRALADAYAASGDKEQALVYYRKILDLSSTENDDAIQTQRGPSIQDLIDGLEQ